MNFGLFQFINVGKFMPGLVLLDPNVTTRFGNLAGQKSRHFIRSLTTRFFAASKRKIIAAYDTEVGV